jgi:hypothetical protein
MQLKALAVLAGSLALAGAAPAFQHPTLAGEYKLDVAASRRSPLAGMPEPLGGGTLRVEQRGPSLVLSFTFVNGDETETETLPLRTDGREVVKQRGGGRESTVAVWSGDSVVVTTRTTGSGYSMTSVVRLVPLDGGRTLEMRETHTSPQRTFPITLVWRRTR